MGKVKTELGFKRCIQVCSKEKRGNIPLGGEESLQRPGLDGLRGIPGTKRGFMWSASNPGAGRGRERGWRQFPRVLCPREGGCFDSVRRLEDCLSRTGK